MTKMNVMKLDKKHKNIANLIFLSAVKMFARFRFDQLVISQWVMLFKGLCMTNGHLTP